MQRKPGFPPTTCNIKVPDCAPLPDPAADDEGESLQRRQQLINFGHSQWGFNNWSWSVTKQDLDFVDYSNGKYSVGVVAFVSISVKIFDIHRENIGYATAVSIQKGLAIYKARKCAVTNALRETLLSFGGSVATELMELDSHKPECNVQLPAHPNISTNNIEPHQENNQNLANKPALLNADPKIPPNKHSLRKDSSDSNSSKDNGNIRSPHASVLPMQNTVKPLPTKATPVPQTKPGVSVVPSVCQPRPPAPIRPNSNDKDKLVESLNEEEMRAERKRRQKMAQEEFRLKQMQKQTVLDADPSDMNTNSFDNVLKEIQTQEFINDSERKRKSPDPSKGSQNKRPANLNT